MLRGTRRGCKLYESFGAMPAPAELSIDLRQKAGRMRCLARGRTRAATIVVLIHPTPGLPSIMAFHAIVKGLFLRLMALQ